MKENTFDVPAYHFSILKKTTIKKEKEIRPQVFYVDKQVKKTLIPFENVDGLLVNEVRQILGIKEITIVCTINNGSDEVIISEYHILNDEVMFDKDSKKTIDKFCEEYMEKSILVVMKILKKYIDVFLKDIKIKVTRRRKKEFIR